MSAAWEVLRTRVGALPERAVDTTIALSVSAVELFNLYRELVVHQCVCKLPLPWATGLVLVTTVPLVWRRRWPFGVVNVVGTATLITSGLEVPNLGFGALVAVFTASSWASPVKRRIVLAILVVAVGTNPLVEGDPEALPEDALTFGTAWILGALARTRRAYIDALELRAEQLEREKEDRARLAAAQERARIAREFHDVVAHTMSVMIVQTQAARSVLRNDPARADGVLEQVESAGRRNLADLRRLLGVLRVEGEPPSLAPQPGLDDLGELADHLRAAGLEVALATEGQPRPLDPATDLSAYRIVQESLTNVLKHSDRRRAEVKLRWLKESLRVEIVDEGTRVHAPSDGAGQGIPGMRERAALISGTLEAGPRHGGGFAVVAELPTVPS